MSESGQKQVNDLANQKIAVKFHNTNLMIAYLMMNNEIDNQQP